MSALRISKDGRLKGTCATFGVQEFLKNVIFAEVKKLKKKERKCEKR